MRAVFRFFSFCMLAAAVLVAAFDTVQSFAAGMTVFTPMRAALAMINEPGAMQAETVLKELVPVADWSIMVDWLFSQPALANFLVLSLLLWMIGYKKRSMAGRFAAG
jgi:hypothetical protein